MAVLDDGSWEGFFFNRKISGKRKHAWQPLKAASDLVVIDVDTPFQMEELQATMLEELRKRLPGAQLHQGDETESDKAPMEQRLGRSLQRVGEVLQESLELMLKNQVQEHVNHAFDEGQNENQNHSNEEDRDPLKEVQSHTMLALSLLREHRQQLEQPRKDVLQKSKSKDEEPEVALVTSGGRQTKLSLSTALAMSPFFPGFGHMVRIQRSPQYQLGMSLGL